MELKGKVEISKLPRKAMTVRGDLEGSPCASASFRNIMQEWTGPSIGHRSPIFRGSHGFEVVNAESTRGFVRGGKSWVFSDRQSVRPSCRPSGAFTKSKTDVAWTRMEDLQSGGLLQMLLAD
jgi:hypothetical protein